MNSGDHKLTYSSLVESFSAPTKPSSNPFHTNTERVYTQRQPLTYSKTTTYILIMTCAWNWGELPIEISKTKALDKDPKREMEKLEGKAIHQIEL